MLLIQVVYTYIYIYTYITHKHYTHALPSIVNLFRLH